MHVASRLARVQAATSSRITNRRHRLVELNDLDRLVARHLDGSRDRAALVELLASSAATYDAAEPSANVLEQQEQGRDALSEALEACLRRLARNALLVA